MGQPADTTLLQAGEVPDCRTLRPFHPSLSRCSLLRLVVFFTQDSHSVTFVDHHLFDVLVLILVLVLGLVDGCLTAPARTAVRYSASTSLRPNRQFLGQR